MDRKLGPLPEKAQAFIDKIHCLLRVRGVVEAHIDILTKELATLILDIGSSAPSPERDTRMDIAIASFLDTKVPRTPVNRGN